jgi:hypothetical protein
MATETTTEERRLEQLHHIELQVPIKMGWFNGRPRFWWGIGMTAIFTAFLIPSLLLGFGRLIVVAFGLFELLLWLWGFWRVPYENRRTTKMAMTYRLTSRRMKRQKEELIRSDPWPETGEILGAYDPDVPPPSKTEIIGDLDFRAHTLETEDGKDELGVIIDDPVWKTASSTFELFGASLLTADDATVEERLSMWANLMAALGADSDPVRWLKLRDLKFQGEPVNGQHILDHIRGSSNLPGGPGPLDTTFVERLEAKAATTWNHRTTLTLSCYLPEIKRLIEQRGSVEQVMQDRMEAMYHGLAEGIEERQISTAGLRDAIVLTKRGLILDTRMALDPVFGLPLWRQDVAAPEGIYLDKYDAYPGFYCLDEEEHPETWLGCVKIGNTYLFGLYGHRLGNVGISSQDWADALAIDVPRVVSLCMEVLPYDVGRNNAAWRTASKTQAVTTPTGEVEYTRVAQIEHDIAARNGLAVRLTPRIVFWGSSPKEVLGNVSQLTGRTNPKGIRWQPLSNRQDKTINTLLATARELHMPQLPLSVRLWGLNQ